MIRVAFTSNGKQVLRNDEHYADGHSDEAAEAIADVMNRWARGEEYAEPMLEAWALINALRAEEMWSVTICHDNPDDGHNCAIVCEGEWVSGLPHSTCLYPTMQFFGDTVLDCLRAAHKEMTEWKGAQNG